MSIDKELRQFVRKVMVATGLLVLVVSLPSCLFVEAVLPGDQSDWFGDTSNDGGNDVAVAANTSSTAVEMQRILEMLDSMAGSDDGLRLDVSDMSHYIFLLEQLKSAGQTPDRSPQLFRSLSQARYDAVRGADNSASNGQPVDLQFRTLEFDRNDPTHVIALARVSAPRATFLTVTLNLADIDRLQYLACESQTFYCLGYGDAGVVYVSIDANSVMCNCVAAMATCTIMREGELASFYAFSQYLFR